jgi:hypothetical protein
VIWRSASSSGLAALSDKQPITMNDELMMPEMKGKISRP